MPELSKSLKGIWLKSMQAISNTASNIASNTKYKVDEMNIVNRRRDILSNFGAQAYEMWQKGIVFPEPLQSLLAELSDLDEQLNAIRTEKLAGVNTEEKSQSQKTEEAAEEEAPAEDAEAEEKPADGAAVESVTEKIDVVMDNVTEKLSKLGSAINNKIEALSKAMKPKTEEKAAPVRAAEEKEEPVVETTIGEEIHAAPVMDVPEAEQAEEPAPAVEAMPEEPKAPVISYEAAPEQPESEPDEETRPQG